METGVIIETERLLLRRPRPEDTPGLVAIWTDLAATRYLGGPRGEVELIAALEESVESPGTYDLWPLVEKGSARVIGHCGLIPKSVEGTEEIEVVYILHPSVWGRGYGREIGKALLKYGFRKLGLDRIIALIDPENASSEGVAEQIGMKPVGTVDRPGGHRKLLYLVENR